MSLHGKARYSKKYPIRKEEHQPSDFEELILFVVDKRESMGASGKFLDQFVKHNDIESSKSRVNRFLNKLKNDDKIMKQGRGKNTVWVKTSEFEYSKTSSYWNLEERYEEFLIHIDTMEKKMEADMIKIKPSAKKTSATKRSVEKRSAKKRSAEFDLCKFSDRIKRRIMVNNFTDKDYKMVLSVECLLKLEKKYGKQSLIIEEDVDDVEVDAVDVEVDAVNLTEVEDVEVDAVNLTEVEDVDDVEVDAVNLTEVEDVDDVEVDVEVDAVDLTEVEDVDDVEVDAVDVVDNVEVDAVDVVDNVLHNSLFSLDNDDEF